MTTSILDPEDLLNMLTAKADISTAVHATKGSGVAPVSGNEFVNRIRKLFTPEQAEALARRIEEGREQAYD